MLNSEKLIKKATEIRLKVLKHTMDVGKGHLGGSLSCVEILVSLYYGGVLRYDILDKNPNRDRFILSKGHAGLPFYVILADLGFFDEKELTLFNKGGILGEHADKGIPGMEVNSGSLGHGLGLGAGMALAAKMDCKDFNTVVLLGDGECYEGSNWEAAMFASHHNLNNLIAIVDRNRLCIRGHTENVNKLEPFKDKWVAFGWEAREVDGHNYEEICEAFKDFRHRSSSPLVVIANTVKGKGVSFMEDQFCWHHGGMSQEEYEVAQQELGSLL